MCILIPVLLLAVKYCVDIVTYNHAKIYNDGTDFYKKCANEAALAVAKKWNPGLTLNQQKESLLRIADDVYNKNPCYCYDSVVQRAIPGLESKKLAMGSNGTYDPMKLQWGGSEAKAVGYMTVSGKVRRTLYPSGGNQVFYRIMYGIPKDPRFLLKDDGSGNWISEDMLWDFHPTTGWIANMAAVAFRSEYTTVGYYKTEFSCSNIAPNSDETITYTCRVPADANADAVQISVENDKIRVLTDSDIGHAKPSECNVDIVLAIPANGAACNKNNNDGSSPTAGVPDVHCNSAMVSSTSSAAFAQISFVQNARGTPIYQIAQALKTFLRDNFEFTRGVNVGLIPYSGKLCIPPHRKVAWTEDIHPFNDVVFLSNQNGCLPYIRGCFLYGTNGELGAALVNFYTNEAYTASNQNDPYGAPSGQGGFFLTWWGVCSAGIVKNSARHHMKGVSPLTAVMFRGITEISVDYGNNYFCAGDLLSTADPGETTSTKWRRMNNNPCYLGYANFLTMTCEKSCGFALSNNDITNSDNGNLSPTIAPPYFLIELQADIGKICDLLNVIGPFWDEHNISNFLFIPITWANNLFQSWTNDPQCEKVDTLNEPSTSSTGGQLSRPSKMTTKRKKALILVVNKPDWFEPNELTYLGFSDDFKEISKIATETIDFSTGAIQSAKGILKFINTGASYNSTTKHYECASGTGTLSFPNKYLVKIVVEPTDFEWVKQDNQLPGSIDFNSRSRAIAFHNGCWVIMGMGGGVLRSVDDAVTFSSVGSPLYDIDNRGWCGCLCGGGSLGEFLAISKYGVIATSPDGINWTKRETALPVLAPMEWYGLTWGNGEYVAVHLLGYVATSPDGINWQSHGQQLNIPSADVWYGCTYGKGKFVVINSNGIIASSVDGINWISIGNINSTVAGTNRWNQVHYVESEEIFVAMSWETTCSVATSLDGINWVDRGAGLRNIAQYWDGCMTLLNGKILAISRGTATAVCSIKEGIFQFTNVADDTISHSIRERTEFFIEPSQMTDTKVSFNMTDVRLISAEITNKPYTINNGVVTFTERATDPITANAVLLGGIGSEDNSEVGWYGGTDGTASEAVANVTKQACAKLKTDWREDIKIYVIKYRKQGVNADYNYIDSCATTGRVYDVSDEAGLNSTLQTIANDIKSWAGYEGAKNT